MRLVLASIVLALAAGLARASDPATPSHYAPFAALAGEWDIVNATGERFGVARFRWGPGRSYLWHSIAILEGGREVPHLEGLLLWNGATRKLDLLFALDLAGGRVQEQGTLGVEPDGTLVRSHVAIGGEGGRRAFRQTYRVESPDRIATAVLRQEGEGWAPTFPGSDKLAMVRRPVSGG